MALNISVFSPSFPESESAKRNSVSQPLPLSETAISQNRNNSPKNRFSSEASILDLSSEALERSRLEKAKPDNSPTAKIKDNNQLNPEEQRLVQKLQARDVHVKMHEQQHMAAGGSCVRGGPTFQYTIGPDGKSYATGGEVQIDVSPVPNNPQATIVKAQIIRRAALAPSDPSGADRAIAAQATQMEAKARLELVKKSREAAGQLSALSTSGPEKHRTLFYVKTYQNIFKKWSGGDLFNKFA